VKEKFLKDKGFTLLEALVALIILTIGLVPALTALNHATGSVNAGEEVAVLDHYAQGKMEEILSMEFGDLSIQVCTTPLLPTDLCDTVTIQGEIVHREVYVTLYDGDGDNSPDPDLKQVKVKLKDIELYTLITRLAG
jgi:prepilin-type N-terminal cleavage/methylation domain-containing protein